MNLTNLAHLVRRIRALLRQQEPAAHGPQLAQDFAAVCQTVMQRLAQCEAMLNQGNDHQTLQQAESPPALMDTLARLGFREMAQWRAYCQAHGYPVPPLIDAGVIRRLNDTYAKGIGADHPLYSDYRGAVLTGDDDAALAALRVIVQLNPNDRQMQKELERREQAILNEKLGELSADLSRSDPGAVLRRLEEIESLNLATSPSGDVWQRGQYVRVKLKLETLPAHREVQDWSATFAVLGEVKTLCAQHGLVLAEPDAAVLHEAEAWAEGQRLAFEEDELHQRTVGELAHLIDQCEQRRLSLQESSLRTLSVQAEALERKWRELERFNRPVPEELEERLAKTLDLLGVEIRVKGRHRRNLLVVSAAAVVLLGLGVGLWLVRLRAIRDTTAALESGIANRQVLAVSNLLAGIGPRRPGLTNTPSLRQTIARGNAWLEEERQKAVAAEQTLTDLAERFGELTPDSSLSDDDWRSWQATMTQAARTVDDVAPDLSKSPRGRLDEILRAWNRMLDTDKRARDAAFHAKLAAARDGARSLDYSRGLSNIAVVLQNLSPMLTELRSATNVPLPDLGIEAVALKEFEGLTLKFDSFAVEMANWHEITNRLATATATEAYLDALRGYATNQFSPPAHRPLAQSILETNVATDQCLQSLLLPGNAEAWKTFQKLRKPILWPEKATDEEKNMLNALNLDANIQNTFTIEFLEGGAGPGRCIYGRNISKDEFDVEVDDNGDRVIHRFSVSIYDPQDSPRAAVFKARTIEVASRAAKDAAFP
ncbi:MAG TPA: hypothetical protein PLF11_08955 [Bacillota bacterium]|jgi:hypothetical protein|nr:MAG: hypothetical protein BWX48_00049 [Verrucomicrobia bacterium ADurb.Bin006]HOI37497.1 hypothetical protein [Bacillota bacterium]